MPRDLPLDQAIPVSISPRWLFALEKLLGDLDTAKRLKQHLIDQGVNPGEAQQATNGVVAAIRSGVARAEQRAERNYTLPYEDRNVLANGSVQIAFERYFHPDLWAFVGQRVRCRYTEHEGWAAASIETEDGTRICVALPAAYYDGEPAQAPSAVAA